MRSKIYRSKYLPIRRLGEEWRAEEVGTEWLEEVEVLSGTIG